MASYICAMSNGTSLPNADTMERLRDYAWKHFAYHAEQRMKCFNFFVLFVGAVIAGVGSILGKSDHPYAFMVAVLGLTLFGCAIIFARLDRRNMDLVNVAREALKTLDYLEMAGISNQEAVDTVIQDEQKNFLKDMKKLHPEENVKYSEENLTLGSLRLMSVDDYNKDRKKQGVLRQGREEECGDYSHKTSFRWFFFIAGGCGLLICLYGIYVGVITWPASSQVPNPTPAVQQH